MVTCRIRLRGDKPTNSHLVRQVLIIRRCHFSQRQQCIRYGVACCCNFQLSTPGPQRCTAHAAQQSAQLVLQLPGGGGPETWQQRGFCSASWCLSLGRAGNTCFFYCLAASQTAEQHMLQPETSNHRLRHTIWCCASQALDSLRPPTSAVCARFSSSAAQACFLSGLKAWHAGEFMHSKISRHQGAVGEHKHHMTQHIKQAA